MSSYKYNFLSYSMKTEKRVKYFYGGCTMQKKHMREYKYLGLNISYYRKANSLSQEKLAELINISRTHMSRIETADCAVSLDVLFDICNVLRISPDKLFEFRK